MATCDELAHQVQELENLLRKTSNEEKRQEILDQISDLNTQQQNQGCFGPPPQSLFAKMTGGIAIVWNDGVNDVDSVQVDMVLEFIAGGNSVAVQSAQFTVTGGEPSPFTIVAISLVQDPSIIGSFDGATGDITIDFPLHFAFVQGCIDQSDGTYHLSTNGGINPSGSHLIVGSPVDASGLVNLVASARLSNTCGLTFTPGSYNYQSYLALGGQLSPWPPEASFPS